MRKKIEINVRIQETDYGLTEEEMLLELMALKGYFDENGLYVKEK